MGNNVAFVLLAGGKSSRMGVAKGLLKYSKTYWILEQLNRISNSAITTVYIGLGFDHQHYFIAIPWFENAVQEFVKFENLNVRVIINKNPELGAFTTLQAVLKNMPINLDILINPIDVPICDTATINAILAAQNTAVLPAFNKKHGHPIKISAAFSSELKNLDPASNNARLDQQIKSLNPNSITSLAVQNADILLNLNTPEVWKKFITIQDF